MDIGFSSRETSKKIGSLIERQNTIRHMISEMLIKELQVTHNTCSNIFKQFQENLPYQDNKKYNGNQLMDDQKEYQDMVDMVQENIGIPNKEIVKDKTISSDEASRVTIQTIFKENNKRYNKYPQTIHLIDQQRSAHLSFAQQTKLWRQNWSRILFQDES